MTNRERVQAQATRLDPTTMAMVEANRWENGAGTQTGTVSEYQRQGTHGHRHKPQVVEARLVPQKAMSTADVDRLKAEIWARRRAEQAKKDQERRWFLLGVGLTIGSAVAAILVAITLAVFAAVTSVLAFLAAHWMVIGGILFVLFLLLGTSTGRKVCTVTASGNFTHKSH